MKKYQFGQVSQPQVYGMPVAYGYPGYPRMFVQRVASSPSQPYQLNVSPEEIEKAIYKDLPTDIKKETVSTGSEPQKVITADNGLEVPAYIMQREIERKKIEASPKPVVQKEKLKRFHLVSDFSAKKPLLASLIAFVAGAIVSNIVA